MRTYRGRGPKVLLLSVVAILITGFALGFAAVSSSLRIKSRLEIAPNVSTFSVVFSSSSTLNSNGTVATDPIKPTKSSTEVSAMNATIVNEGSYPTITLYSDAKANQTGLDAGFIFTESNQSVTYTFYAINVGADDAYLTNIVYNNSDSNPITCTAIDGTNSSDVATACAGISLTVSVGNETVTSSSGTISGHKLAAGSSEQVTITINSGNLINNLIGDFKIQLSDITLLYSSVDGEGAAGDDTGGSTQVYKPQYYSWSWGSIGDTLPGGAETTVSALNPGYPFYLGLDAGSDNIVTAAYVCFTRNGIEYCLKGGDGGAAYASNQTIIQEAFADSLDSCSVGAGTYTTCDTADLDAYANSDGNVNVGDGYVSCYVDTDGLFECHSAG